MIPSVDTTASVQAWLALIIALIGVAGAIATYFRGVISQNKNIDQQNRLIDQIRLEQDRKIHEIQLTVTVLETRSNVLWKVIENDLPKVLMRPHTPEIDHYMTKIQLKEPLTDDEKRDMIRLLREAIDRKVETPDEDAGLRVGYLFMIYKLEGDLEAAEKKRQLEEHFRREQEELQRQTKEDYASGARPSSSGGKWPWSRR